MAKLKTLFSILFKTKKDEIPTLPKIRPEVLLLTDNALNSAKVSDFKISEKNQWKGWYCNVGQNNLIIENNGNIYASVCKSGGKIGTIQSGFDFLTAPRICDRQVCHCADDIKVPKAPDLKSLQQIKKLSPQDYVPAPFPDQIKALAGYEHFGRNPLLHVNWNLGKKCNFDCSYCPESVHNKTDPYPDMQTMKKVASSIFEKISESRKVKFTFTGGEPTLIPHYVDFLKWLRASFKGRVDISTNTNGSRNVAYLSDLLEYSSINFSAHFEFITIDKVVKKVAGIAQKREELFARGLRRHLSIKMMVTPSILDEVKKLQLALKEIPQNFEPFKISLEPIVQKENNYALASFSDSEKTKIKQMNL